MPDGGAFNLTDNNNGWQNKRRCMRLKDCFFLVAWIWHQFPCKPETLGKLYKIQGAVV